MPDLDYEHLSDSDENDAHQNEALQLAPKFFNRHFEISNGYSADVLPDFPETR